MSLQPQPAEEWLIFSIIPNQETWALCCCQHILLGITMVFLHVCNVFWSYSPHHPLLSPSYSYWFSSSSQQAPLSTFMFLFKNRGFLGLPTRAWEGELIERSANTFPVVIPLKKVSPHLLETLWHSQERVEPVKCLPAWWRDVERTQSYGASLVSF